MKQNRALLTLLIAFILLGGPALFAQEEAEGGQDKGLERLGLIFSAPSILLELDEYQGAGVGAKAAWNKWALRGLVGFQFDTAAEESSITVGTAVEYHLGQSKISPYVGAEAIFGYAYAESEDTKTTEYELGVGPLIGVEYAVAEGLSLFAEYKVGFTGIKSEVDDPAGDDSSTNYYVATELGNYGALGIVVYFLDRGPQTDAPD